MIEKHYGKYVRSDAAEQLAKLAGAVTQTVTLAESGPLQLVKSLKSLAQRYGGPTWTRTRDQPVMSRWL